MFQKKIKFVLTCSLFTLVACGENVEQEGPEIQEDPKQTIAGVIKNASGKTVIARVFSTDRWLQLGQAKISENGSFNMKLPQEVFVAQLVVDNVAVPIVLDGDDSIYVEAEFPKLMNNFKVSNIDHAKELNEAIKMNAAYNDKYVDRIQKFRELKTGPEAEKLLEEIKQGKKPLEDFAINFIDKNPSSAAAQLIAMQLFPDLGLENWNTDFAVPLNKVLSAYQTKYPEARFTRALESNLNSWVDGYEKALVAEQRQGFYKNLDPNVEIGNPAPDIWMDKPDGSNMKLSDLKGQYVLVDFWASWCGPCRKENPNVVRLYNKYKDKGFTVFSVSLDDNAQNWKGAIEADQLIWPNHVSDLLKWNSVVVQLYKIQGIPHTVLLDKKGTIIGKNLRGQELENKLREIFGS